MVKHKEAEKFEKRRTRKMAAYIVMMTVVITAIVGVLFYRFTYNYFIENFIAQNLAVASSLADAIDGDTYTRIFHDPNPAGTQEYQQMLKFFTSTADSSEDIQYAYTFHLNDDRTEVCFGFDGELEPFDCIRIESLEFMYIIWVDEELKLRYVTEETLLFTENDEIPFSVDEEIVYLSIRKQDGLYDFCIGNQTVFTIGMENDELFFLSADGSRVNRQSNRDQERFSAEDLSCDVTVFFNEKGASVSYPNQVYVDEEGALAEEFEYLLSSETAPTYFVEDTSLGDFYTFYAPIFDKTGHKVARVGLDVDVYVLRRFSRDSIVGFIQTIIPITLILLCVFIVLYYVREKRLLALNGTITYLNNTLYELKTTQDKLVKTEKQAALGRLISNIAHEINNPISAILNSSQLIGERLRPAFEHIARGGTMDEADFDCVNALVDVSMNMYAMDLPVKQRIRYRKDIPDLLKEHGCGEHFANGFIKLGIYPPETICELLYICERPNAEGIFLLADILSSIIVSSENIYLSCKKVSKIVHLLKLYSSDTGFEMNDRVDAVKALDKAVSIYQSQFGQCVTVKKHYQPPVYIKGNEDALQQVFMNLVQNAFQSMTEEGTLELHAERTEKCTEIRISDTGVGMDEAVLSRIFEPFFSTRGAGEGSGLGMFLVKNVLEYHAGEISLSSKPGQGTCVTIRFPVYIEEPQQE